MRTTVIRGREITAELSSEWSRIVEAEESLSSPYFDVGFTRAVSQVRNDVYVSVTEDAGQVVALFPFQRGRLGVGRPVGGPLSDYHGVIARSTFNLAATELIRASGLSSWSFDHCVASQDIFKGHHRVLSESPILELSRGYRSYAEERRAAGSKQIVKTEGLARKLEREVGPIRFEAHDADATMLQRCIEWKRSQYAEMGVNDVLGPAWTRALLGEVRQQQSVGLTGMLSTLSIGDRVIAIHMGMRSKTVWHYWFPAYDAEMAKFSPGIILLLRMAEVAPTLGIRCIDLGKGATMYKDRLSNGAVEIAEGRVELPSVATSLSHLRRSSEEWIRRSPFVGAARVPGRFVKRAEKWLRFR